VRFEGIERFTLNKIDIPKFINGFEKSITLSLSGGKRMKINEIWAMTKEIMSL
jgi:hypothetical protein